LNVLISENKGEREDMKKSEFPIDPEVYRRAAEKIERGEAFDLKSCWAVMEAVEEMYEGKIEPRDVDEMCQLYRNQYAAMFGPKTEACCAFYRMNDSSVSPDEFDYYVKDEKHVRHPFWESTKPCKSQRIMALLMMAAIVEAGG
jgi:hypothetical protein